MSLRRGLLLVVVSATTACGAAAAAAQTPGRVGSPTLTPRQTSIVRLVVDFIDAFNRREARRALSAFTSDPRYLRYVGVGDCDYAAEKAVGFRGRRGVAEWLRGRFTDRDVLVVKTVRLIGDRGAVIEYERRKNTTLTRLGYPEGIRPKTATKVGVTTHGPIKITQFANAAGDASCRIDRG